MGKSPYIFSRFGSTTQIENSVIGIPGVVDGTPSHPDGFFGKGVGNLTTVNKITYVNGLTTPNLFAVGFWWKPSWGNLDANFHDIIYMNGSNELHIFWNGTLKQFEMYAYESGYKAWYFFNSTHLADTWYYIMGIWDGSGAAGQKLRLLIDRNPLTPASISFDNTWNFAVNFNIYFKQTLGAPDAVFDNFKLWDYDDIDPNFRWSERGGIDEQPSAA